MNAVCKLTGKQGTFVKSHLIPLALTRPIKRGEKFIESGLDQERPIRRPSSWYDENLVTLEGEALLSRYDTQGIDELRRLGLVWSSARHRSLEPEIFDHEKSHGVCALSTNKPKRLRLFALSLLWRAVATEREEFKNLEIDESHLEYLRDLVRTGSIGNQDDFPTYIVTLLGPGDYHNRTPLREIHDVDGSPSEWIRFFIEGVIILIGLEPRSEKLAKAFGRMLVGFDKDFFVMTIEYSKSRERDNLIEVIRDMDTKRR